MKDKGLDLIAKLPPFQNYRSVAYRKRKKIAQVDKLEYKHLKNVEVPPAFSDFLLGQYSFKKSRILIFASEEAREMVKVGKLFFGDGTFKRCPKPFKQLYVLFCDLGGSHLNNNVVQVIYALLPNKLEKSYNIMFQIIKSQIPEWEPNKFITDYEPAPITAMEKTFPKITHHGCFFHYQDKLKRKAKQLIIFNKKKSFNKIISLCMVLPHLPCEKIEEGFRYILNVNKLIGCDKKVEQFLSYFQRYWLPKKTVWCFDERHRTTNVCEAWNSQFNQSFKRRPTIIRLLKHLNEDAAFHAVHSLTLVSAKQRSNYVIDRNNYIAHIQMQLVNGDIGVPLFLESLR